MTGKTKCPGHSAEELTKLMNGVEEGTHEFVGWCITCGQPMIRLKDGETDPYGIDTNWSVKP